MFRLTREVRFAVNATPDAPLAGPASNSYGGFPTLIGLGHYFALQVTLAGPLDSHSSYLRNIKEIDSAVRRDGIRIVESQVRSANPAGGPGMMVHLYRTMQHLWPGVALDRLRLFLSPLLSLSVLASEIPMVRLSQKFEFSATHRLHNPHLSESENQQLFGKCNNPLGHGHNYEVEVALSGEPDATGRLIDIISFEKTVATAVIDRFDHRNLNLELPEFRDLIPTVENIAMVIYQTLKPHFAGSAGQLASVKVWETPKTCCEYSE